MSNDDGNGAELVRAMGADGQAPKEWWTVRDIAKRLGVSTQTIWRWVASGKWPEPQRWTARLVRWPHADIRMHLILGPGESGQYAEGGDDDE